MHLTPMAIMFTALYRGKQMLIASTFLYVTACGNEIALQTDDVNGLAQQATQNSSTQSASAPLSAGRFNFVAPRGFAETGRSQSIYGTNVVTTPLRQGQSATQLWAARIAATRQEHNASGADAARFRQTTVAMDRRNALGGGTTAPVLFFHVNPRRTDRLSAETAFATQTEFVNLRRPVNSPGTEYNNLRLFELMIGYYRENSPQGFSVGAGTLVGKPSTSENVRVHIANQRTGCEITLTTDVPIRSLSESPFSDFPRSGTLNWDGTSVSLLEHQNRTLMSLRGETGITSLRDQETGEIFVEYSWFFEGEVADPFKPEIRIKMGCDGRRTDTQDRTWDAFLETFNMRPE